MRTIVITSDHYVKVESKMKTERIHLRVTSEFKDALTRRAKHYGLTVTEFLLYSAKTADIAKIAEVRDQDELGRLAA